MPKRLGWGTDAFGRDRTLRAEAMGVGVRLKAEARGVGVEVLAVVQLAKASISPQIVVLSNAEFVTTEAAIEGLNGLAK
jgi:hypothetical protein